MGIVVLFVVILTQVNMKRSSMWNAKQKRCYQRIMSGLTINASNGVRTRFLTLTSSWKAQRGVQDDFRVLKMRIKRKFGNFEYIKIRTNEGNGVLHFLYTGSFIPQIWLSRNWNEIHQSPIVDIREASRVKGLGKYVVSQYLSDQRCSFLRYSWSWGWVYRGFVKYWKKVCCAHKPDWSKCVMMWNKHLSGHDIMLDGKLLKPPPDVYLTNVEQTMLDLELFSASRFTIPTFFVRLNAKCDWL
jgi:hypothetical protein